MERVVSKQNLLFGSILRVLFIGYWNTYISPYEYPLLSLCIAVSLLWDTILSYTSYVGRRLAYHNLVTVFVILLDMTMVLPYLNYTFGARPTTDNMDKNEILMISCSLIIFVFSTSFDVILNIIRNELR